MATAVGALVGGVVAQALQAAGSAPLESYRVLVVAYAVCGLLLALLFLTLSPRIEVQRNAVGADPVASWLGLHRSRSVVLRFVNRA